MHMKIYLIKNDDNSKKQTCNSSLKNLYKVIVNCKKQNLVKAKDLVQKHDNKQEIKKCKAVLV